MRRPTKKECPGCKTLKEFYAGDVCYSCEQKLKNHDSYKAAAEMLADAKTTRIYYGERLGLAKATYKLPGARALAEAFSQLVRASFPTTEVVPKTREPYHEFGALSISCHELSEVEHRDHDQCQFVSDVPKDFLPALRQVHMRIDSIMRECRAEGQAYGQNLLFQMNDGSLSLDDFNERLSRAQRHDRH